jgi:hypothetical protein
MANFFNFVSRGTHALFVLVLACDKVKYIGHFV